MIEWAVMENYRNGPHSRYDLKYHFVWVTKYRKPMLVGEVGIRLRELVRERTGLSMRTVAYSLKRLLETARVFWNKPKKKQPDRYDIALYKIDPEISDC